MEARRVDVTSDPSWAEARAWAVQAWGEADWNVRRVSEDKFIGHFLHALLCRGIGPDGRVRSARTVAVITGRSRERYARAATEAGVHVIVVGPAPPPQAPAGPVAGPVGGPVPGLTGRALARSEIDARLPSAVSAWSRKLRTSGKSDVRVG